MHANRRSLLPCSCIRKFGASTQRAWLWLDVLSDLLFLVDLCTLLLSAFYTDRAANVIVASQTASVEAGQHSQTCLGHQHTAFDRKLSKLNLAAPAEAGGTLKRDLARSMSRSRSKRDVTLMQGPNGGMDSPQQAWCKQLTGIMTTANCSQTKKRHEPHTKMSWSTSIACVLGKDWQQWS